jgi:hypothetical protein
MAALNLNKSYSRFIDIRANNEGVSISFPLRNNGLPFFTSLTLSLQFHSSEDSMHIDEEVFDALTRIPTHTIGQFLVCNGDSKL